MVSWLFAIVSGWMILFVLFPLEKRIDKNVKFMKGVVMRKHYDFSKSIPNPYVQKLKKQITIRLDEDTIEYFKGMADEKGIPYQSLINLYLRDCAQAHRDLKLQWQ